MDYDILGNTSVILERGAYIYNLSTNADDLFEYAYIPEEVLTSVGITPPFRYLRILSFNGANGTKNPVILMEIANDR